MGQNRLDYEEGKAKKEGCFCNVTFLPSLPFPYASTVGIFFFFFETSRAIESQERERKQSGFSLFFFAVASFCTIGNGWRR